MNNGFFSKREVESKTRPTGKSLSCTACGLYKDVVSPKMKPFGEFKKGIMNIGEFPGETDDKRGKQWQGKAGKFLEKTYKSIGIDLFEDCININAINCRPINDKGSDRLPTAPEIDNCRKIVLAAIEKYKPKVIILFGQFALQSIIGHRWKKDLGSIQKWRGWNIPDQDFKCFICPVFHPTYVIRQIEQDDCTEIIWRKDLKNAIFCIDREFPIPNEPEIEIIEDLTELNFIPVKDHLNFKDENAKIKAKIEYKTIAFDYETTGLKPHAEGHRIVCASIADTEDHAYVFMMPKTRKERLPFIEILKNPNIRKVAQNMKFEHTWSVVRLNTEVVNWHFDTMLASHTLDNREGVTGLKFQTYVQFGIVDYDSEINPYLRAEDEKNGNSINRIMELVEQPGGSEKLLRYCAMDSIYEYRLAKLQTSIIKYPF